MSENSPFYTVQEISDLLEAIVRNYEGFNDVLVKGEISELKIQESRGHVYFTLKDKDSQIPRDRRAVLKCVLWRENYQKLTYKPQDGDEVLARGSLRVYSPYSQYSFYVTSLNYYGVGKLLAQIQALRQKLYQEGLITRPKKKLPVFIQKLGIVTALNSAALRDMLKQIKDRHPGLQVLIAPASVQGKEAVDELIAALREITKPEYGCEVVIIGRGGGSLEDLMAFNDEALCREIANSPIPIISAVGHQIDNPISNDVADFAAATPTEAARVLLEGIANFSEKLNFLGNYLNQRFSHKLMLLKQKFLHVTQNRILKEPKLIFESKYLFLDQKSEQLKKAMERQIEIRKKALLNYQNIPWYYQKIYQKYEKRFQIAVEKLEAYSVQKTLNRGYSIVRQNGNILRKAQEVDYQKKLEILFSQGKIYAQPEHPTP